MLYVAVAWLLQLTLYADFAAEARGSRRPRRSVDLLKLNWSDNR
jgi:hypothetical protein